MTDFFKTCGTRSGSCAKSRLHRRDRADAGVGHRRERRDVRGHRRRAAAAVPFPQAQPDRADERGPADGRGRRHRLRCRTFATGGRRTIPSRTSAGTPPAFAASIFPVFPISFPSVYSSANLLTMLQVEPRFGPQLLAARRSARARRRGADQLHRVGEIFQQESASGGQLAEAGQQGLHVIGVMPAGFEFPYCGRRAGGVEPLVPPKEYEDRDSRTLTAVGRLKDGVSIAAAQAELTGIQTNIAKAYPALELDKRRDSQELPRSR